ncbi:MAG TPA: hypothetical protein VG796_18330 [Verrucomicrobiales bacterium]|jgi:hypothetical protein|nr:hypothetical protein [Verrucomicrobiales bacterium]
MDDQQQSAVLEELRKLRGEVRALKIVAMIGVGLMLLFGLAFAKEYSWFGDHTIAILRTIVTVAFIALAAWILWISVFGTHFYRGAKEALSKSAAPPGRE